MQQLFRESEVRDENIDSIMGTFEECDLIHSCLDVDDTLFNIHKRSAYVKRNCYYVMSKSIYAGVSSSNKFRDCLV